MRTNKASRRARLRNLLATLFLLGTGKAMCQNTNSASVESPLLDLFVKKGYVTQQEAEQVEQEAQAMQTNNPYAFPQPSKWKITAGIKSIQLYGDIRMRYEMRSVSDPADNNITLDRIRYALRFGLRGDAADNFYYGLRLETSTNPRSPWVTLGTSTSGVYDGPFGKSEDGLGVGQVYIGWNPVSWFDVTIGKTPNLLYTTPMVWDSDINQEGAFERFKYTVGDADFFANLGQFYYADFNPNNSAAGLGLPSGGFGIGQNTEDIFMFAWQGGFTYHITSDVSAKIAATLYNYTGLQPSKGSGDTSDAPYFGDTYIGEGAYNFFGKINPVSPGYAGYSPGATSEGGVLFNEYPGLSSESYPFNQVGLDHLLVLEIPFELNFRVEGIATRFFGDFAYNLNGKQRAEDAAAGYSELLALSAANGNSGVIQSSFPAQTHDVKAYQIGIGFGSDNMVYGPTSGLVYGTGSHKHDWEVRTYWQHIEQYSLDPNLIDSDFFEGRENLEGVYASAAYAIADNFIITVRYGYAHRINDLLGTGGDNLDIPQMNPINQYHLFQADATLRF